MGGLWVRAWTCLTWLEVPGWDLRGDVVALGWTGSDGGRFSIGTSVMSKGKTWLDFCRV